MGVPLEFIRNVISLAAFVVTLCEAISNLEDELAFIWRRPITWAKGAYVMTRYSALIGSVINVFILFWGPMQSYPVHHKDCRSWFALFSAMCCVPLVASDAFSMIRIYILYERGLRVAILTVSLVITQMILVGVSATHYMDLSRFTQTCQIAITPRQVLGYIIWLVGTQLALIGLTFYKRRSLSDVLQGTTIDLALQQGMVLCSIISAVSLGASAHSLMTGFSDPIILALWPSVVTSSVLCRIILVLQQTTADSRTRRRPRAFYHDNGAKEIIEFDRQLTIWLTSSTDEVEQDPWHGDIDSVLRRRCPSSGQSYQLRIPMKL